MCIIVVKLIIDIFIVFVSFHFQLKIILYDLL